MNLIFTHHKAYIKQDSVDCDTKEHKINEVAQGIDNSRFNFDYQNQYMP